MFGVMDIPGGVLEDGVLCYTVDLLSLCCELDQYIVALVRRMSSLLDPSHYTNAHY
jgi:hypothetical protein